MPVTLELHYSQKHVIICSKINQSAVIQTSTFLDWFHFEETDPFIEWDLAKCFMYSTDCNQFIDKCKQNIQQ